MKLTEEVMSFWLDLDINSYHWNNPQLLVQTHCTFYTLQRIPTIFEITETWANSIYCDCGCGCLQFLNIPQRQQLIEWLLITSIAPVECVSLGLLQQFARIEDRLPRSRAEFVEYISSEQDVDMDLLSSDKVYVGTNNLEHLPTAISTSDDLNCGICQENIAKNADVYIIPGCGHQFHCIEQECLLNEEHPGKSAGILDWLQIHHTCPLCLRDVVIQ
jgi:hypothetical protein